MQIVQKCTIRKTWNERGHICLIIEKLSKSSQALKFGFTARQYRNRANSYSQHKARHKGNQVVKTASKNRLSGGLGLNRGNWQ